MVTSAGILRQLIRECLAAARPKTVHIGDIYGFVEENADFDREDHVPPNLHGEPVNEPRWKRNVRNVLKSESDQGLILRIRRGEYMLPDRTELSKGKDNGSDLEDARRFVVGQEYRDTGKPGNKEDRFMGWINLPGSGIKNAGGIRGLRSLRSGAE